jgi:hypothetical protein
MHFLHDFSVWLFPAYPPPFYLNGAQSRLEHEQMPIGYAFSFFPIILRGGGNSNTEGDIAPNRHTLLSGQDDDERPNL